MILEVTREKTDSALGLKFLLPEFGRRIAVPAALAFATICYHFASQKTIEFIE